MEITNHVAEMDAMVSKGQILEAVNQFFASNILTTDTGNAVTSSKEEKLQKLSEFFDSIQNVNGITFHHSATHGDVSYSEYTFDFDMKDGSKILWHEIIRRQWQDGKVINEQYFKF